MGEGLAIRAAAPAGAGIVWDEYYRHFARMMSEFLPKAHGLMAPRG